jgi:hypothetical protein
LSEQDIGEESMLGLMMDTPLVDFIVDESRRKKFSGAGNYFGGF